MSALGLTIRHLVFTGPRVAPAQLDFEEGLNLLYGASNTGKSFTLKAIDFMLGARKALPEIPERDGYDKLWFCFSLGNKGNFTLSRSVNGGSYELYNGFIKPTKPSDAPIILAPTQQTKNIQSLPHFLLEHLNFSGKRLATNAKGETVPISFRDIAAMSLVDETSIQSELSPVESGQYVSRTRERSLFRLFLTGLDDSKIVPIEDKRAFYTSMTVRIELVEEMLQDIETKLSDYPDIDDLASQNERLSTALERMQSELDEAQGSIRNLVNKKLSLSTQIIKVRQRIEEIKIHLVRFAQLEKIYHSDIERLDALEEAGFLISLDNEKPCALCGAPPESQKHIHDIINIEQIRKGAIAEISKIKKQNSDLKITITALQTEVVSLEAGYPFLAASLDKVEFDIKKFIPNSNENRRAIIEIITTRDHVKYGLSLLEQKNNLFARLDEFKNLKKPSKDDKLNLKAPDSAAYKLCKVISNVLKSWKFPGDCLVSFDENNYDLKIDGKLRISNGKGVRAVTHAAFKVALLIYCRENQLPHPGFVVLDTPLLAYRDPIKNQKAGELTEDEKVIARSALKQSFFEHLSSIKPLGQFIILENIDPPDGIDKIAHVQMFYGHTGSGRSGLFPAE
jgi:DNA repair ATPase RecN